MSDKDRGNLMAILDSVGKIQRFSLDHESAESFHIDEETFDAVLLNFVIIGEAVSRISEDLKDAHPQVPWRQIKGFRDVVAHDYFGVDAEEVWQIIKLHLPELVLKVSRILD